MRKGWTILQALTISLGLSLVELRELHWLMLVNAGCWLMLISSILLLITVARRRFFWGIP